MTKDKTHCDYYISKPTPVYKLNVGDCIKPINGRFSPTKCNGVCKHFDDMAYKIKKALNKISPNRKEVKQNG